MDLPSWMWHEIKKCGAKNFDCRYFDKISVAENVELSVAENVELSVAAFVEFYCRIHVSIFIVEILCRILL